MSGGYHHKQPAGYHQQNNGYQNPAYRNNSIGFASALSEEYMRQPASSPYPTAPIVHMPEAATVMPVQQDQPRLIILQQAAPQRDEHCCRFARGLCSCIDWLLTQICYVIFSLVLLAVLLGLALWLYNKYKHH